MMMDLFYGMIIHRTIEVVKAIKYIKKKYNLKIYSIKNTKFAIYGKKLKNMKKTFVIAEIGINHNGNMKIASNLIKKAKLAGADAVKFQTYITDILVKKDEPKMKYQKANDKTKRSQYKMLKKSELNLKNHKYLIKSVKKIKFNLFQLYDLKKCNFYLSKTI